MGFRFAVATSLTLGLLVVSTAGSRSQTLLTALPTQAPAPPENPTTPEKVALGRLLFWDPLLSGQKDVSCATCHHPDTGYAETLDLSIGTGGVGLGASRTFATGATARPVKRNSQTVLNTAFNGMSVTGAHTPAAAPMFWDLRVNSLEAQALEPIKAADEMRGNAIPEHLAIETVVSRLDRIPEYRDHFQRAFGGSSPVTATNMARAIAAFERTLVTANAPFDRYMRGDTTAMTAAQVRGMNRFQTIGCARCHSGPMFSDFTAHVLGVPDNPKLPAPDTGANNQYAFRTASLRNLAYTAPYMHNGTFATLQDVVAFYDRASRGGGRGGRGGGGGGGRGGRGGASVNPNVARADLDPLLRQLNMRGGRNNDLVAFLEALSDPGFDRTVPERVPSGLKVGGTIQ
jgi:cytochrome c peroxidase